MLLSISGRAYDLHPHSYLHHWCIIPLGTRQSRVRRLFAPVLSHAGARVHPFPLVGTGIASV
jgi:hypothetical protein